MKFSQGVFVFVFFLSLPAYAKVGDNYVCIAEKSVGFNRHYKGYWESYKFDVNNEWVVNFVNNFYVRGVNYIAKSSSSKKHLEFNCIYKTSRRNKNFNEIICGDKNSSFSMNTRTLRYIEHYIGEYISGRTASPYIEIGRCIKSN